MELHIWCGDWSLPSIDPCCLEVLAYISFTSAPVHIIPSNNPRLSPTGQLPVLFISSDGDYGNGSDSGSGSDDHNNREGNRVVCGAMDIMAALRERGFNADYELSSKEASTTVSLVAMIRESVYAAILYSWWVESSENSSMMRSWHSKALPFPLSWTLPKRIRAQAMARFPDGPNENTAERVFGDVAIVFDSLIKSTLTNFTNGNGFALGPLPTTLDAVVYGYLAPIFNIPLPKSTLKNVLETRPVLQRYCDRVKKVCLVGPVGELPGVSISDDPKKSGRESSTATEDPKGEVDEFNTSDFVMKRWASIAFGAISLFSYVFVSGMVRFSIGNDRDEDEYSTDDDTTDDEREEEAYDVEGFDDSLPFWAYLDDDDDDGGVMDDDF